MIVSFCVAFNPPIALWAQDDFVESARTILSDPLKFRASQLSAEDGRALGTAFGLKAEKILSQRRAFLEEYPNPYFPYAGIDGRGERLFKDKEPANFFSKEFLTCFKSLEDLAVEQPWFELLLTSATRSRATNIQTAIWGGWVSQVAQFCCRALNFTFRLTSNF